MKNKFVLILLVISLPGCATPLQQNDPDVMATPPVTQATLTGSASVWSVYHPDPDHLWNRVFRQLYHRATANGEEYGFDEIDPLLWLDTTYLLEDPSHEEASQVLDEFLLARGESLIHEPLKRAMFQRDLWAVCDWLASQSEPYPSQRRALERRLAQIMKKVALSKAEIASLPDNYALAIESSIYPANFQGASPETAFLPAGLQQPDSAWVPMGREGGPVAMTHTEAFPFFGRSVFLVFLRSPDGRAGTLRFINALNTDPAQASTTGSDVALARRMLLIDDGGHLVVSPLIETIQIRHFSPMQSFYEFELDRTRLFSGIAGGLVPNNELFMLFMGHGDIFNIPGNPYLTVRIPEICKACHLEHPPLPNPANTQSIISYSRQPFPLADNARPSLFATTVEQEAQTVIEWKRNHETWTALESLWNQASP